MNTNTNTNMNTNTNTNKDTKFNGNQQQQNKHAQAAAPCTSPWTEAYQFAFAEERQRTHEDRDSVQPTLDALSDIYNRGYVVET